MQHTHLCRLILIPRLSNTATLGWNFYQIPKLEFGGCADMDVRE